MGIMTVSRSEVPGPAAAPLPAPAPVVPAPTAGTSAPVAAPLRKDAVRQADSTLASLGMHLAEAGGADHPAAAARAAAEAARDAYIKASIAAGISPLPLP